MQTRHEELRDELIAVLQAGRELTPDADTQLAEAFVRFLDEQPEPAETQKAAPEICHQPHYSLLLAGGIWGATVMFLLLALIIGHPTFEDFVGPAFLILLLATLLSKALLFFSRNGWHIPHVHVSFTRQ